MNTYTLTIDGQEFEFIPLHDGTDYRPYTPRIERMTIPLNAEGQDVYKQWFAAFRDALRAGTQIVDTLGDYLRMCRYPTYLLEPWHLEVWVPARFYQIASHVIEHLRIYGLKVTVMIEEL